MQRLDAPAAVPAEIMRTIKSYRQACRVCRQLSPRRRLTWTALAEEAGLIPQHITDYFHEDDAPRRRNLPPESIAAVERVYGNSAISQWVASNSTLTVMQQIEASARAAA